MTAALPVSPPRSRGRNANLARVEELVGRELTEAEQHVDVLGIDRALNRAKNDLEAAIQTEQRRLGKLVQEGRAGRLELTDRMARILLRLHQAGRRHALRELRSMGYPVRYAQPDPDEDAIRALEPLLAQLRAGLGPLTVRVRDDATDALLRGHGPVVEAAVRVLGARAIAAAIVSPAFIGGLGVVFEDHADLIDCWEYSAVLDRGTCDVCRPLDGRHFDSLEELFRVLPNFGPNPRCLGGQRCRCRAVPCVPSATPRPAPAVAPAPARTPVSASLLLPVTGGRVPDAIRRAVGLIDGLIGVTGTLARIPVKLGSARRTNGSYRYRSNGAPVDITISRYGPTIEETVAHEIGHFLDHQLLGSQPGYFGSISPELAEWRDAVAQSEGVAELLRRQRSPRVQVNGAETRLSGRHLRYLLSTRELWARSFAQWVAVRSGDPEMLRTITNAATDALYPDQWADDDFGPIAEAIDRLFERLGWRDAT